MKSFLLTFLLYTLSFSNPLQLQSFEADFTQTITDEKGKILSYSGDIKALKPQYALWTYSAPVEKRVYVDSGRVVMVEPEIEQVIIRKIRGDLDFFTLLKNAKKIDEKTYITRYEESDIFIKVDESKIVSLSYKDKFDNDVKIVFSKQLQNSKLSPALFQAVYPLEYDIIKE